MRQEVQKVDESQKKPEMSLLMIYQTVREKMDAYLANTLRQFPLPSFMVEGILSGMLADIRANVISQLSGEREAFDARTAKYYESELEKMREQIRQMTADFEAAPAKESEVK